MSVMKTKQRTYPESVQPGIPRLRNLKEGWHRRPIGELLHEVSRPITMDDKASYNLVTVKRARGGVVKRATKQGKSISVKSQFEVRAGDFLISKRQIVHGACGIVPAELDGSIVSNEYSVLNCKDSLDSNFLSYLTNTTYFQQTCFHSSIGVHIEKMIFKLNDWFKWKIDVPPLAEQQRIAAFIGSVDNKLVALRRQRELLQAYKRGMMQKIFLQELRFKADDGAEFPNWQVKRLRELADLITTKNTGSDVSRVLTNSAVLGVVDQLEFFDKDIANSDNLGGYYILEQGDYVYNPRISVSAPVGPINKNKIGRGVMSPLYTVFRFNSELTDFYDYYFHSTLWHKYMKSVANYGARHDRMNISNHDLMNMPVPAPHLDEQQKIADFLSAIDAKIDAVAGQIEKMTQFKKGLLQQMFV